MIRYGPIVVGLTSNVQTWKFIARPMGLHYNNYVSECVGPSVRPLAVSENVHYSEQHGIFWSHVAYIYMPTFPNHCMACKSTFLMYEGLLSISHACCNQLVKILITLDSYHLMRYFDQIFAYSLQTIDVTRPLTNDLWVFLFQTIDA